MEDKKNILDFQKIQLSTNKYLSRGLTNNFNIKWEKANDEFIFVEGLNEKVIDFTAGILVNCLGYNNQLLKHNINKLLENGIIHSYHYQTSFKEKYLESLYNFTADSFINPKLYLTSSGTEATESCMKIMLRHGQNFSPKKNKILSIEGNYHGRTMGAALMGTGGLFNEVWPNIYNSFPKIKFPYLWEVKEEQGEDFFHNELRNLEPEKLETICGIIIETYQGWGACSYPKSFIKAVKKYCKQNNIILAFDEMQAGFYRTGLRFGFQHYEIKPDIICIGKGMGAGLPLSGLAGNSEIMQLALPGELSSTHSCNPISCVAGNTVIEIMESEEFKNNITENAALFTKLGNDLKNKFEFIQKKSNFMGMVGALVFDLSDNEKSIEYANKFCEIALTKGVLVIKTGRESVKLSPPLTIRKESIEEAFKHFEYILNLFC